MIDTTGMAFQKPRHREKVVTLSQKEKTQLRREFFVKQAAICGCGCGRLMTLELGQINTAELEHHVPNKMGCVKNDAPENLYEVWRSDCNAKKGSKRI
jgi:hypothetical protein